MPLRGLRRVVVTKHIATNSANKAVAKDREQQAQQQQQQQQQVQQQQQQPEPQPQVQAGGGVEPQWAKAMEDRLLGRMDYYFALLKNALALEDSDFLTPVKNVDGIAPIGFPTTRAELMTRLSNDDAQKKKWVEFYKLQGVPAGGEIVAIARAIGVTGVE